jgi:organic hydroperoxide reductase OsmC/OhrA
MIQYPLYFEANAEAHPGTNTSWNIESSGHHLECAVPTAFEGIAGHLSPEDLFLLAIQNCFIATFKVYAYHSKLHFNQLKVEAKLTVDKDEQQKPCMHSVHLKIYFSGVESPDKCRIIVKKTLEQGFILRSVKSQISHELLLNQ